MANFHALERMLDNAVGAAFAENVKIVPQKKNGGRADSGRPPIDVLGILHFPDEQGEISLRLGDSRSGVDTMASGIDAMIVIQRVDYPDLKIYKNDLLRALEAPGAPWFSVVKVNANFSSILVVHLVNDARSAT